MLDRAEKNVFFLSWYFSLSLYCINYLCSIHAVPCIINNQEVIEYMEGSE